MQRLRKVSSVITTSLIIMLCSVNESQPKKHGH